LRNLTLKTYLHLLHQAQRASQDPTDGLKVFGPVKFHEFKPALLEFLALNKDRFEDLVVTKNHQLENHQLENRSYHFIAFRQGQIQGVLRLTPFPFLHLSLSNYNISSIADLRNLPKHLNLRNFLEINRFVVSRDFSLDRVAERLLLSSGLWSVTQTHMEGFLGLVPQSRLEQFSSYSFQDLKTEVKGANPIYSADLIQGRTMGTEFEVLLEAMTSVHEKSVSSFHPGVWVNNI